MRLTACHSLLDRPHAADAPIPTVQLFASIQLQHGDIKDVGETGGGAFTTVVELKEQRILVVSLLHHMAVQRLCHNPFEEEGVIGIANYLDIGLQASSPQQAESTVKSATSWHVPS